MALTLFSTQNAKLRPKSYKLADGNHTQSHSHAWVNFASETLCFGASAEVVKDLAKPTEAGAKVTARASCFRERDKHYQVLLYRPRSHQNSTLMSGCALNRPCASKQFSRL
jgi:hypothetical protein